MPAPQGITIPVGNGGEGWRLLRGLARSSPWCFFPGWQKSLGSPFDPRFSEDLGVLGDQGKAKRADSDRFQ
jgi:hypothetical protein